MENNETRYEQSPDAAPLLKHGDRLITVSGYLLVVTSVICFGAVAVIKVWDSVYNKGLFFQDWLSLAQNEVSTISLLVIALVAASIGKSLLTTARMADARTIPYEDLPLIRQAVIDGVAEPIDQYVRLRSLTGMSGTFTKLGITGLPLTTVALTLIFSAISLLPLSQAASFLDLAKLTLGAFIGSFVQRQVEQRRRESSSGTNDVNKPELSV
ncbi:MAG: hypothetical protein QM808_14225 [Steroidobacteraceae bacterium]